MIDSIMSVRVADPSKKPGVYLFTFGRGPDGDQVAMSPDLRWWYFPGNMDDGGRREMTPAEADAWISKVFNPGGRFIGIAFSPAAPVTEED